MNLCASHVCFWFNDKKRYLHKLEMDRKKSKAKNINFVFYFILRVHNLLLILSWMN